MSSVYFWPFMYLTPPYQPFRPMTTLFTCRFGEHSVFLHVSRAVSALWPCDVRCISDWVISNLFFARRIDLTILHSTMYHLQKKTLP